MTDVTANASGGTDLNLGIYNETDTPTLTNVTANATGPAGSDNYGIYDVGAAPQIRNSVLSAGGGTTSYGIFNFDWSGGSYLIRVDDSIVSGTTNSISNDSLFTVRVGASKLSGSVLANGGTVTCAGVYNSAYTFFASSCP
jgi:hypothetical protein